MKGSVRNELFGSLMDENGHIDSYAHAKEISVIAFQQDQFRQDMFGDFVNECIQNGVDPALELIRLEEMQKPEENANEPAVKMYSINQTVYKALPKKSDPNNIKAIRRVLTKVQPVLFSQNPFVKKIDDVVQSFITTNKEGALEIQLDNGFDRLLCHCIANYYNLVSYSTGTGNFRVTRVMLTKIEDDAPSLTLTQMAETLNFVEEE
ncbi:hypothetical protein EIN_283400 [Entamoeba invadens IP1]|uniref:R3H domain-containing protein n=1 Tax=Entamoeba invadens IP1 TaxID=370355 RepID=L7FKG2_ENTIV|nr:hypothetical protein EIN_283400 [Entamoeba invadens IP1]ELP84804.1 hypothetical protein EIN_283400 [Entamoeba invadens IP1]|eukprot:XP_004184150.1 hypothetical protein EIN_283400 [Entamoeba invadens IP1]